MGSVEMARFRKTAGERLELAHTISVGVLGRVCPRKLVDEVLAETGKASQRVRLLPAPSVVYYVMALALYRELPLEEVMRVVTEGLRFLGHGAPRVASQSSLSLARRRLGPVVMQELACRLLRPIAERGDAGAWYRGLRLTALDGTCLDVADEAANASYFGYHRASRGHSAFPQARALGLVECGSHAIIAGAIEPYSTSEVAMAPALLGKLDASMLLLVDRGFYSFQLWQQASATGAQLLWRVKTNLALPVERRLADGSYLSTLYDSKDRKQRNGQRVRVIEYKLANSAKQTESRYRLITTLLDPADAPAEELAALYHERWEVESVFDELKAHLGGGPGYSTMLRSKTPELVKQEFWGMLLAHFGVRQLMQEAARAQRTDPDRLSFSNAVRVIKRKLPQAAALPP
jgi:hypothetical protein